VNTDVRLSEVAERARRAHEALGVALRERDAVIVACARSMSYGQIARAAGMPRATVASIVRREEESRKG